MRRPEETIGGRGSKGTALRLTVMPMRCSVSSACWPLRTEWRRSASTRWTSVPPLTTEMPAAAPSSWRRRSARILEPSSTRTWRSWNSGSAAILKATALAAMTCSSGPPCCPGKTAELTFLAMSASLVRITPPRGPPRVLCVVLVTMWACGTGLGCSPAATRPAKGGMSNSREAPHQVRDAAEFSEVQLAGVSGPAGDDQLRLALEGEALNFSHVYGVGVLPAD